MTGHGAKFGRKKEEAIVALLTTRTTEEAARAVKVTAKTLLRWMKEPEFDAAYRAAKRAAFGQSIARLHHLSSAAVTTLGKVMLEPGTPPATRVRAADSILDHTTKAIEIEGLEARLTELERAAEATAGRSGR
jgi:hypothetical protein